MRADDRSADVAAIEKLIERQFASVSWTSQSAADWETFAADFVPAATLYPAARPVERQTVEAFIERMKGLAGSKLPAFQERMLGADVQVFGNVATALAACEIVENQAKVTRGVEMLLLIKDEGAWRIVSQAWDTESETKPIPERLLAGTTPA